MVLSCHLDPRIERGCDRSAVFAPYPHPDAKGGLDPVEAPDLFDPRRRGGDALADLPGLMM